MVIYDSGMWSRWVTETWILKDLLLCYFYELWLSNPKAKIYKKKQRKSNHSSTLIKKSSKNQEKPIHSMAPETDISFSISPPGRTGRDFAKRTKKEKQKEKYEKRTKNMKSNYIFIDFLLFYDIFMMFERGKAAPLRQWKKRTQPNRPRRQKHNKRKMIEDESQCCKWQ